MATAYCAVYLACPDGHFYGQGAQQPLTRAVWRGPGQPTHLTVLVFRPRKQDPGSSLGPALRPSGQGDQKKRGVCVRAYPACSCASYQKRVCREHKGGHFNIERVVTGEEDCLGVYNLLESRLAILI